MDLEEVAEEFGTPTYVMDLERTRENFLRLDRFLSCPHVIAYAYKANSEPELVRMLASMGAGATVPSAYGIMLARWAGVPSERTVLVGPSPSNQDLKEAVEFDAIISLESASEALALKKIGRAKAMVRVNPGLGAGAHPSLVTGGRGSKFGLPPEDALKLFDSLRGEMRMVGLHSHIGSQIMSVDPFRAALGVLVELARRLGGAEVIDIGGGLGVPYSDKDVFPLGDYAELVCGAVRDIGATLYVEAGRYIVADAGYLLSRVNYVKNVGGEKWILVDAGMNEFIRPALYGEKHGIICSKEGPREKILVAGPVCESTDFFGEYELPPLREGDLLAFTHAGAYGFSMASRYNLRPLSPVVAVEGGKHRLLRHREGFREMFFGC